MQLGMPLQDRVNVGWMTGDVSGPRAKTAMSVHCPDPLGQEFPLRLLLLVVLTFHFENQSPAIRESNQKIRPKLMSLLLWPSKRHSWPSGVLRKKSIGVLI